MLGGRGHIYTERIRESHNLLPGTYFVPGIRETHNLLPGTYFVPGIRETHNLLPGTYIVTGVLGRINKNKSHKISLLFQTSPGVVKVEVWMRKRTRVKLVAPSVSMADSQHGVSVLKDKSTGFRTWRTDQHLVSHKTHSTNSVEKTGSQV